MKHDLELLMEMRAIAEEAKSRGWAVDRIIELLDEKIRRLSK